MADEARSVATLVSDVASDVKRLLQQEVELARLEIRGEAQKAASAGGMIASAAMALHLVAVLASVAGVLALSDVLADRVPRLAGHATVIAAGGVGVLWLIVGLVLLIAGRRRLRSISLVPRKTLQTLKEDVAWLRKPTA